MKFLAFVFISFFAGAVYGQGSWGRAGGYIGGPQRTAPQYSEAQQIRDFIPKDSWRVIDGETNYAKGGDWVQFVGKVLEVQPNGIRVEGYFGDSGKTVYLYSSTSPKQEFFVMNFPYQAVENQSFGFSEHLVAKKGGVYSYITTDGASRTILKLDYGKKSTVPAGLIEKQQAAFKAAKESQDIAGEKARAKALDLNRAKAEQGDAYGEFRMGERYRDGDGVERNLEKAKEYFAKAAAHGNNDAGRELKKLQLD